MDHEVVPRPYKICHRLLNLSWTTSVYTKEKNIKVTMEFEVPKRHISRLALSIDMVQRVLRWERQKRCFDRKGTEGSMAEKCCYSINLMIFFLFWGGRREDEDKTREWSNFLFSFQNYPFWTFKKKINTFTFGCMVIPLDHIQFTTNNGPKGFIN